MPIPKIDEQNRKKPLCYDPARKKYILFDEIVSGEEPIIPLETLSNDEIKQLIITRQLEGPDYKVQAISGPLMARNDVVRAIEKDEEFGKITVEAEISYLKNFLKEIQKNQEKE